MIDLGWISWCLEVLQQEWLPVLLGCIVLVLLNYWWKSKNLPPGPTLIPFVGIIPGYVGSFDPDTMRKYSKEYNSDIISIRNLGTLTCVLNSRELIKETFVIRKDVSDRCSSFGWQLVNPDHGGLLTNSGHMWSMSSRSLKRLIKDFGYDRGDSSFETLIIEEAENLNKHFAEYQGEPFDPDYLINGSTCSIMFKLLLNKDVGYDDPEVKACVENLFKIQLAIWNPFGQYFFKNKVGRVIWSKYRETLLKNYADFGKMPHKEVDKHVEKFNGEVSDLCDGFLGYMKEGQVTEEFDVDQLKNVITDLVEASIESTKIELIWFFIYMAAYPEVQEKVYQELIAAFGKDSVIHYNDKGKTPFLFATIYELLRCHIEVPFGVHQCCKDHDIEIRGYTIPKDTAIAANYTWLNKDPADWKYPDTFNPENFLENGKLVNMEKMASFSIGRRSCIGEPVAKVNMYIFFANWIREFKIKMPEGVEPNFETIPGSPYAQPFKIRMIKRS